MKRLYIASLLLLIALCGAYPTAAQPPTETPVVKNIPYADLLSKVQQQGYLPVIVSLNMAFQPEGRLSLSQAADQRRQIISSQDRLLNQLNLTNAEVNRKYSTIPALAMNVDLVALQHLIDSPEVKHITEDKPARVSLEQSIPKIRANNAWAVGFTGQNWTVAILDVGFDTTHPFLQGKIVSEACYSYIDSYFRITSLCPNGRNTQIGTGAAKNCPDYVDGCEHGTHVAGIVAGKGTSFSGVAKDATLIAIQVFFRSDSSFYCSPAPAPCIYTMPSSYIAALERVYELRYSYNIAAVNMSLGGDQYYNQNSCDNDNYTLKNIIDNLRSAGIATVAASGNSKYTDSLNSPACISSVVSVGATDDYDNVAYFSNSAYFLDLLAPGVDIYSAVPSGKYANMKGTSMASPHVAGAWAIRKAVHPLASVDDILDYFKRTGVPIRDYRNNIVIPRIQVDAELSYPSFKVSRAPNSSRAKVGEQINYTYRVTNTGNVNLTLTVQDSEFETVALSPNPVPPGTTAIARRYYSVTINDLPGPLVNEVSFTGTPAFGTMLHGYDSASVDLTEVLIAPSAMTTATLYTTDEALAITIPPDSLPYDVTQFYYTRLTNLPGRLPAVFTGLGFELSPVDFSGQEVNEPFTVTLELNYDPWQFPDTVAEHDLGVYRYDSFTATWLTATVVASDTFANTLTLETDPLGIFALTGQQFTNFVNLPIIVK